MPKGKLLIDYGKGQMQPIEVWDGQIEKLLAKLNCLQLVLTTLPRNKIASAGRKLQGQRIN